LLESTGEKKQPFTPREDFMPADRHARSHGIAAAFGTSDGVAKRSRETSTLTRGEELLCPCRSRRGLIGREALSEFSVEAPVTEPQLQLGPDAERGD
jgi:hypothetical protein